MNQRKNWKKKITTNSATGASMQARSIASMAMTPFYSTVHVILSCETLSPSLHAKRAPPYYDVQGLASIRAPCSKEPGSLVNWNGTRRAVPLLLYEVISGRFYFFS